MTVYAWLVVLVLLAALLMHGNVKGNKKYIFVAFLLLFCVMGLRDAYSVGNDAATSYLHGFQRMEDTPWSELSGRGEEDFNIGFSYLMKLGYVLTEGDYQLFTVIISAFMMIAFAHFVKKYSPSPVQSVLYFLGLLFYSFMFNALKQAIAMSILMFAFDAIVDKKPGKFIILTIIAAQFHYPAFVFLPAYWIGRMNVKRGYLFVLAIILLITYLLRDDLLKLMLDAYGNEEIEATMEGITFLRNKAIIMIVIVVAALILRPISDDDVVYSMLLKLVGVSIVFQTFCGYNNIFERLADYYFQFSIVFIPLVFEKCDLKKMYFNPKTDRMVKSMATAVFCAFAIWRFVSTTDADPNMSHYIFFFQSTIQ